MKQGAELARNPIRNWGHDELAHDLAEHLRTGPRRMVWEDMQLGSQGSPRPDVYSMMKSFQNPNPFAYEVKVSVSDFRHDVRDGKWESYLAYACGVTFAIPKGLVKKGDVPPACGLMTRSERGWHTVRAPQMNRVKLPERALLKLLMDGLDRLPRTIGPRCPEAWDAAARVRKTVSDEVADFLADKTRCLDSLVRLGAEVETLRTLTSTLVTEARDLRVDDRNLRKEIKADTLAKLNRDADYTEHSVVWLKAALGLDVNCSVYTLTSAVEAFTRQIDEDERYRIARAALTKAASNVEKALQEFPGDTTRPLTKPKG